MQNKRCYGKKNVNPPKREKSFIRKFFEGNTSSEASLFGESSENILEKDSLEENKENEESLSPAGSISVKSISPEKDIFSETETNTSPVRKKKVKRKRVIKRKPKQVFPHSTKHYVKMQPRWSEIYRHDLTIEKQGGNKKHSHFSSRGYKNYNKIRRTRPITSTKNQEKIKIPTVKEKKFPSYNSLDSSYDYIMSKEKKISRSDSLDSSDDYIVTKVTIKKCSDSSSEYVITQVGRAKHFATTASVNACDPKGDLNNASCANIIPELSNKQFEKSVKSGDFSLAPDPTFHNAENLVAKEKIYSNSDSLDSSNDYNIAKVSGCKNIVTSESVNACDPDLNNASCANIPELSKQFEESVKLGDFSLAPDPTFYNAENLVTKEKKISSTDSLDSSNDYIITKDGGCKNIVTSESMNALDPEDLNNASSANIIPKLSKQFEESVKLGDFSLAPDPTFYNAENLCSKSPIFFTKFKEIHKLKSHVSENLNVSDNLKSPVSNLRSDDISVKTISSKSNRSKQSNPTSVLKFMTSTPKVPNSIYIHHPVNVDSSYDKSCGSGGATSKASYNIPYSMIIEKKSLNFYDKKIDCSESYLSKRTTPNNERMYVSLGGKSLPSNLVCSNKSISLQDKKSMKSVSSVKNRSLLVSSLYSQPKESHETMKIKLLELCNQDSIAAFSDVYDWKKCRIKKIGEGSFAEVYMITQSKKSCVLKVIPVSEDADDNCEGLSNVLSEVKITRCLSELRNNKRNNAKNFIKMNRVFVVTGIYAPELIVAWDHFSDTKTSYNVRPDNYKENKMFVLLELEFGGTDMSSCVLRNALEAECVLKQVATALAVAEEEFIYEHRDLHLGNILIKRTPKKYMTYKLRGNDISFECHGVQATLIDFTLSRLYEEGYIYYNDLAGDKSLFEQSGDFQFQVYKDMKNILGNQWQECCFYSNILWLKYLCQKFKEFEYSRPSTIAHKKGLKAIDKFNNDLTNCNSAIECLTICGITPICFERSNTDSELTKKSVLISRNSIQKSKLSLCH